VNGFCDGSKTFLTIIYKDGLCGSWAGKSPIEDHVLSHVAYNQKAL